MKLLRPKNTIPTTTRLVLQTGSRAGLQAPLQQGYYMIGRHKECQIRPKSRSVSRYHCLLYHDLSAVQVLDLESTSGTRVNEKKLTPKSWVPLSDGDMLRCGKIVFRVNLDEPASDRAEAVGGPSMIRSEAWHEVDIAEYLGSADDADRDARYESIRQRHDSGRSDGGSESDVEVDIFAEDFDEDLPASAANESVETSGSEDSPALVGGVKTSAAQRKASAEGESRRQRPVRPPRQKRKRLSKAGPSWSRSLVEPDRLKMIAAVMLTILTLSCLAYSGIRYYHGPEVRVLEGID